VRLRSQGAELCYACHGDLEGEYATGRVHTAVKDGLCTGCHDPHMAGLDKMLRAEGAQLCFPCHTEIEQKLAAEVVHAVAAEGCDGCHDPHRGDHDNQLLEAVPELCLMCHDADDSELRTSHLGADLSAADCTSCHDPHGSTEAHLISTGSVHPPFVEDCETCHEGSAGDLLEGGGSALCYACHSDIEEVVGEATVAHAAMEMADCTDCHSPHASAHGSLLRDSGSGVCATCHEDQEAGEGEVRHGVIDWIGCHSCHEPHGGSTAKLLKASGNELCNGCHLDRLVRPDGSGTVLLADGTRLDAKRSAGLARINLDPTDTAGHPIAAHPVSGEVGSDAERSVAPALVGEQLSCLSCHVPHTAKTPSLFAYGATASFELCNACHPK
jgi:predicted CXXCH cytochrome family protein